MNEDMNETGRLLEYTVNPNAQKQDGTVFTQHTFTFKISTGVTDINVSNEDYIEGLLKRFKVDSLSDLATKLKSEDVPLYFTNSDNYIGYSLTESFDKNVFPHRMGMDVVISDIDASPTGVTFKLADGTVARRSFSKLIGADDNGDGGTWYPDIQKQLRFIKNLNVTNNPLKYDLNDLKGQLVSYAIKTLGRNEYFDILEVKPASEALSGQALLDSLK